MNFTCYILSLCLSLFGLTTVFCQTNYVYNGDFELYDSCPLSESGPGDLQINHCLGWTTPTYATSDYFNVCAQGNHVGVPNNILGYQYAYSGNAYCGFLACSFDTLSDYQWWEYIQGDLSQGLESGSIYKLSIELALAEDSYYWVDKIGVYLSENVYNDFSTTLPLTNLTPQFQTPAGTHINDTTDWMHFEWYFIASGTERYITIGNFNDFYHSNAVLSPQVSTKGNSYVYVDKVSITSATEGIDIPNVFTPDGDGINDTWAFPLVATDDFAITILNRWGNTIQSGLLSGFSWDGKDEHSNECSDGVYFYVIQSKQYSKDKQKMTGMIQLVR